MPQYFIPRENIRDGRFFAGEEESRHIVRAARGKKGDRIEIFDGQGVRYSALIEEIEDGIVSGSIQDDIESSYYKLKLTLCFAVVSRAAMESLLEHCTEAGVETFQPVMSSRSQFDLFSDWKRRSLRLNNIILSASKQCGRGRLPGLEKPRKFDDLLLEGVPSVLAMPGGKSAAEIALALAGKTDIRLFVGPEGGFTKGELDFAAGKGVLPLDLGKYTLRAETACLAGTCALLNTLG
ncbi:MAG: RsmE family RNA methyltransferase [Elusimicrobia bacterium]|nr:RsmE family RNA methyltransferase [Elusimicrobiota bacterium]